MRNASSSGAAAEAVALLEAASLLEAAIPIAAAPIPTVLIAAQSEAAIHIVEAFIPIAESAPVDMKVSLGNLL